jgi:hypothetical protein
METNGTQREPILLILTLLPITSSLHPNTISGRDRKNAVTIAVRDIGAVIGKDLGGRSSE